MNILCFKLLLAPLIISARPAEPIQSTPRDARQLLAPVHYLPWAQPALVPDHRYGIYSFKTHLK